MRISTARGEEILFDDDDAEAVLQHSWVAVPVAGGRHYAVARISPGVRLSMHRFLMRPAGRLIVHHRNNDGLDNRRENLVVTTQSRNIQAAHYERLPSVHLHNETGRWRVQMRIDGIRKSFGMYGSKGEALAVAGEIRKNRLAVLDAALSNAIRERE